MFRLEINGEPHTTTYGEEGEACAKAREVFKLKAIHQVRVYECASVRQLFERGGRCILHLGTATVRKTA